MINEKVGNGPKDQIDEEMFRNIYTFSSALILFFLTIFSYWLNAVHDFCAAGTISSQLAGDIPFSLQFIFLKKLI